MQAPTRRAPSLKAVNQLSAIDPNPDERIHSASQLSALVEQLGEEGIGPAEALRELGLPADALSSPDVRVTRDQLITALSQAAGMSLDPGFFLRAGARIHVSSYGLYGFAMLSSTDFRRTMDFMVRYHQLAAPLVHMRFREGHAEAAWVIEPLAHPLADAELSRRIVELQLAICASLHRDIMGEAFKPLRLEVDHAPAPGLDLASVFGCPVLFRRPGNTLVFGARWLDCRPKFGNAVVHADAVRLCASLLADMERRVGVAGRVRQAILKDLMRPARLDTVARQVGMSGRALRRKLAEEGLSFREVVDGLKRDVALKYLRQTSLTVEEIAQIVGFSEPNSFRHAFRRWTGKPPSQFRTAAGTDPRP